MASEIVFFCAVTPAGLKPATLRTGIQVPKSHASLVFIGIFDDCRKLKCDGFAIVCVKT